MKETALLVLSMLMLIVLCFCLRQYYREKKGYRSKSYHILLLMLFWLDTALAHALENIHIALEHMFKSYKYSAVKEDRVRRKEERLDSYRKQIREESEGYKGKGRYNRKILQ